MDTLPNDILASFRGSTKSNKDESPMMFKHKESLRSKAMSVKAERQLRDEQRAIMLTLKRDITQTEAKMNKEAFEFMPPDILPLENDRNIQAVNHLLEKK